LVVAKAERPRSSLVLIVDRDELVRWSVAEGLKERGYPVRLAADVGEALRCRDAEVVLLDHDPPRSDGFVAAAGFRRLHPGCAVVLMCSDPSPPMRRRAREGGIHSVLEKPFSLEALLEAVRGAMEGTRGRSGDPDTDSGASGDRERATIYTGAPNG
jgi:two-component system response regulator AtoC